MLSPDPKNDSVTPSILRTPDIVLVLSVDMDDPSTSRGVTEVMKKWIKYTSVLSSCGNVRRKMVINGIDFEIS